MHPILAAAAAAAATAAAAAVAAVVAPVKSAHLAVCLCFFHWNCLKLKKNLQFELN